MSDKVYVPNTFPTPNVLVDSVMPHISASAFKVLIVITRLTLGWRQETAPQAVEIGMTGPQGLCQLSGLSHQSVISAVRELSNLELILVKKGPRNSRTPNQYALNLDLTTGQLVKNLDQSKNLSSPTSQNFRPKLVKIFDSLKGRNTGNTKYTTGALEKRNAQPDDPEFERAWSLYPDRAGDNPKQKAKRAWRARLAEGGSPIEMVAGVERYAAFIRATGQWGSQWVKHAATFFGPDKHYRESWAIPDQRDAGGFVG